MLPTDALTAALAGRYSLERLVGEGGMAKVYLARDLRHHRPVALKVLRPDLGAVIGVDRFQAEIQVTANLQHPNLLPLFDSGMAGELLYYVMPYIDGESLRVRLDREKQLPIDEAIRLATSIATALDYAHRQGVVHRDLKPENILIQDGQPLVADFGIALAISNAGGARITQTGVSLGTPQYMSPEQATGDRAIDGRTDVYSLGVLTYEMLTGEPPHVGSTSQAIIARLITETPRNIRASRPSVPEHVAMAVDRALEKLPADRWATARDFAEALTGVRQVVPITPGVPSVLSKAPRTRVSRVREIVAWTLVAGLGTVATYLGFRLGRPAIAAPTAEFGVDVPEGIGFGDVVSWASIALSRDGSTLVFAAQKPGERSRLYSRRLDERFAQEIRGTEGAISPVFAPNGQEVLFAVAKNAGATIKRIDVAGGVARTLSESGLRDGQISWRENNQVVMATDKGIALVNADDGSQRIIASADTARGFMRYGFPDVLPGGKAALIAIWTRDKSLDSIFIGTLSIPDGKVTNLGIHGYYPRYSSTGHVVYVSAAQELTAVPFDARTLRVAGPAKLLGATVGVSAIGASVPLAVSDKGTLAFVETRVTRAELVPAIVTRAGVRRFFGAAAGYYSNPRVSPDGREIAHGFSSALSATRMLDRPDVWRTDVSTGKARRVTNDGMSDRPIWSRDGREIYFSHQQGDTIEYVTSLADGAQPRAAFHSSKVLGSSDVGPAHGYAVFNISPSEGRADLWVAPMDSLQNARAFAAEPYLELLPRISPDGRFVAYASHRSGRRELYLRSILGDGEEIKVSPNGGNDPAWSRDGRELFFKGQSPGATTGAMMMVAQITWTPKPVVKDVRALFKLAGYFGGGNRPSYDVFPNGDFVLLATQADTVVRRSPLVVRLNWTSALQDKKSDRTPR